MSLVLIVGFPQSGKTWDAACAADTHARSISPDARCLAWGPRFEYWPRRTLDEFCAAPLPRVVLEGDGEAVVRYMVQACDADAAVAGVIDEAHRLFRGDDVAASDAVCEIVREHRHTGASWYISTQNLVGLPSEIETDAGFLVLHRLPARYELPRLRVYEDFPWVTDPPAWAGGLTLSQIVDNAKLCHGAIIVDRELAVLSHRACSCAAPPTAAVRMY